MKTMLKFLACISVLAFVGCAAVATNPRPQSYYDDAADAQTDVGASLFSSDGEVLDDEGIRRVLDYQFKPKEQNRIGILALGRQYWFGWSDELAQAGTATKKKLSDRLQESEFVFDASFMPSILIPEQKSVGHFREAAARYQADLLLIYRSSCQTYDKYRFFRPDKAKSYCNVEAVLLDTRSGLVPLSVSASRNFTAQESSTDMNRLDRMRRAQLQALGDALEEVGTEVVSFFDHFKQ